jgi:hypothetical protein
MAGNTEGTYINQLPGSRQRRVEVNVIQQHRSRWRTKSSADTQKHLPKRTHGVLLAQSEFTGLDDRLQTGVDVLICLLVFP